MTEGGYTIDEMVKEGQLSKQDADRLYALGDITVGNIPQLFEQVRDEEIEYGEASEKLKGMLKAAGIVPGSDDFNKAMSIFREMVHSTFSTKEDRTTFDARETAEIKKRQRPARPLDD